MHPIPSSKFPLLLLALCLPGLVAQEECGEVLSAFVEVSGTDFTLDGAPFHFVGANSYYLMTFAADSGLRWTVDEVLADASAMGMGVIRTWAFNDGTDWNALQTAPGVYDESVFEALDYVIYQADNQGLKLTLTLVNNWADYGGMDQYVAWSPTATTHDDFYTDPATRQYYKDYLEVMVNRVNVWTGRAYRDEPAIFAWELANEPRCPSDPSGVTLTSWVAEMSSHLKALDPNHLVTVGSEGFYGDAVGPWYLNGSQGSDFRGEHSLDTIDFAGAHSYPDHWGLGESETFELLDRQLFDSEFFLQKPFVLGEFGKLEGEGAVVRHYDPSTWVDDAGLPLPAPGARPITSDVLTLMPLEAGTRLEWYEAYLETLYLAEAGGSMVWSLAHDERPDYDGFTLYYPGSTGEVGLLSEWAGQMGSL